MKKSRILFFFAFIILLNNILSCRKAEPIANTVPDSPGNLTAQLTTYNSVTLKWSDNSANESGFKIERKLASGSYTSIATVDVDDTTYFDEGLQMNTSYTYRLQAFNAVGASVNYSNEVNINTGLPQGIVLALNCNSTVNNGNLITGEAASGVSSIVSYTTGNGGTHTGQVVNSTGVLGLTATLVAGTFESSNGTLNYDISGTPVDSGIAIFALNIGGRTCNLLRSVSLPIGVINTLNCSGATNVGELTGGQTANGVSTSIPYNGGNRGTYSTQTINSTGVTGLTATLSSGAFANGNGNLNLVITGTPSNSGTANFTLNIGGQSCTFSRNVAVPVGSITSLNCGSAINGGTLTANQSANGVSSVISYTGGNGGTYSNQIVNSTGVTGLTATATAGNFAMGSGNLTYTITGIPSGGGNANFNISIGGQNCTLSRNVNVPIGNISSLDCLNASIFGTFTSGQTTSNAICIISYSGGNGGTYTSQSINSTGVTGLTATLSAGNFAINNGSLNFTISGTPTAVGTANFLINIGNQSCTLPITVIGSSTSTCGATGVHNNTINYGAMTDQNGNVYKTIVIGNQEWMAENLKATSFRNGAAILQVTSDASWGAVGSTTSGSCVFQNNANSFLCPYGRLYNWFAVADSRNLCPSGWHVPTQSEMQTLMDFLGGSSIAGLKLKTAGTQYWQSPNNGDNSSGFSALPTYFRSSSGQFITTGTFNGRFWTSTTASGLNNGATFIIYSTSDAAAISSDDKKTGYSVRCVRN